MIFIFFGGPACPHGRSRHYFGASMDTHARTRGDTATRWVHATKERPYIDTHVSPHPQQPHAPQTTAVPVFRSFAVSSSSLAYPPPLQAPPCISHILFTSSGSFLGIAQQLTQVQRQPVQTTLQKTRGGAVLLFLVGSGKQLPPYISFVRNCSLGIAYDSCCHCLLH